MPSPTTSDRFLILLTLPKSGTNLFRIAMTNYFCHLAGDLSQKTYRDLRQMFPNTLEHYVERRQSASYRSRLGFRDFIYQHGEPTYLQHRDMFPGAVVTIVRNPLDFLVSAYHFFFHSRQEPSSRPAHPIDIADAYLPLLVGAYRAFRVMDCLLLHYEDLFEATEATLAKAAAHYGLPIDHELIRLAVRHSSIEAARDYESRGEPIHVGPHWRTTYVPGFRFVRSGQVGQWRDYFTPEQVEKVREYLAAHQISLDDFRLYPGGSR